MPAITRNIASHFPITAKINPLKPENYVYLGASAILTRFAVSGMRILQNRPAALSGQDMTEAEKKQAFAERTFIEVVGTAGYIYLLHLGQDIAAKFLEWKNRNLLVDIKTKAMKELAEGNYGIESNHFSKAYDVAVNNLNTRGLISNMLYEGDSLKRASKKRLCAELGVSIDHPLPPAIRTLGKNLNLMCFGALLFGITLSAVAGGYGIQWFNDHILSPYIKRKYPESMPSGFLTLPSTLNSGDNTSTTLNNPFQTLSGSLATKKGAR